MKFTERLRRVIERRRAYRRLFYGDGDRLTEDARIVIADLSRFCRLYASTSVISRMSSQTDIPGSFQAEGRREVILRVLAHLKLDDSDIFDVTEDTTHD